MYDYFRTKDIIGLAEPLFFFFFQDEINKYIITNFSDLDPGIRGHNL